MEAPLLLLPNKKTQYLGTFGIIKSAIEIPLRSHTFVFLTSLPFFFLTLLQKCPSVFTPAFFNFSSWYYYYYYYYYHHHNNNLVYDIALVLEFTAGILKSWLLDFFRFLVAITTIYSASILYTTNKKSSSKNLMLYPITKASLKEPILTFLFMTLFSLVSLVLVSQWGGWGPLVKSRTLFFHVVHGITYALALIKWSEHCALWNVGVVISFLEWNNKIGLEAFSESSELMRGNRMRGTVLMVFYNVWKQGLSLPTFFPRWGAFCNGIVYKTIGTILMCLGLVMNWVVCVVYYHDCKNRQKGKVVVKEEGEGSELVGAAKTDQPKDLCVFGNV